MFHIPAPRREAASPPQTMPNSNAKARRKHRSALALLTGLAALLIMMLLPSTAVAQSCSPPAPGQVAANGCAATVAGGSFSTSASSTPVFLTQNGGSITTTAPVTISSTGVLSPTAQALTGATITMTGGSVTSSGAGGNKQTPALRANGTGSSITTTNTAIATNGGGAYAVISENNAAITLHGGTVDTFNTSVHAAGINTVGSGTTIGGGATITADQGLVIRATDIGAFAEGGTINLDTVTITERATQGNTSGLRADTSIALGTPPGLINANNVTITMTGNGSSGVLAVGGGKVAITNSTISTGGTSGFGMSSAQIATTFPTVLPVIDASNVTITTSGIAGHGAFAFNGAIINLNNVDIHTSGDTAYGVTTEGFLFVGPPILTQLNGTNVTVHATGPNAYGAVVDETSEMNLTDSLLSATGTNAGGIFVGDTGSVGTLLRTTVTSAQLDAGRIADSGHLFVTDSDMTGARYGVSSVRGTAADPNIGVVSGGTLIAGLDAFHGEDTIATLTVRDATEITNGSGNLFNLITHDPATLVSDVDFTTENITTDGDIIADATSIANIHILQNSTITGIELNTFTDVDASSTWIMDGNSDIHLLRLAGQTLYTPPTGDPTQLASYKILRTQNYVGEGGLLGLNTFLGDDSAPSDRLVINGGTATGTSFLRITNTTGPGALTLADGILVVDAQNGATTVPGAFSLANRVAAGAFEYGLFRGGVSDAEDWFLRSSLIPRNEVPVDIVVPALADRLGLGMLGTYNDRVGADYPEPVQPVFCKDPDKNFKCAPTAEQNSVYADGGPVRRNAFWGRVFGESGDVDHSTSNFEDHGPSYDYDMYGLQAGMDVLRQRNEYGTRDVAGVYAGYARIDSNVDSVLGDDGGDADVDGYSGGAYWTRLGAPGWYIDAVVQGTYYDARTKADGISIFDGEKFDTDGWGFAASLEGGYPIDFGDGFGFEPQAQLVYQYVDLNDGHDSFSDIDYDATSTFYGRLGGRLTKNWQSASGRHMTAWLSGDAWSDFGADAKTTFTAPDGSSKDFNTELGGDWGRAGLGLAAEMTETVSMFISGDYGFDLGSGSFESWGGHAGFKVKW